MKLRGAMIILIIACQAAIYTGGLCSKRTLGDSVDNFCNTYHLADLQVTFDLTTAERLPKLSGLDGISKVTPRLMIKGAIHLEDNTSMPAVIIFVHANKNPDINTLDIEAGSFPTNDNLGAVIERGLKNQGYTLGKTITFSTYDATATLPVIGIARSPEFLMSTANPELLVPTPGSLGIVYVPAECFKKEFAALSDMLRGTGPANQLLFLFHDVPPETKNTYQETLLARLSDTNSVLRIREVLRRDDQFGIKFLREDLKMFDIIVLAIVGIFSVITLIVISISVNRLVLSQQREIGALMAFGYRPGTILMSYVRLGFLLGLTGGLVGVALSPAVNHLLAQTYASAMSLPPLTLVFDLRFFIEGVLIVVAAASIAVVAPVIKIVRLTPVQAMRESSAALSHYIASLAKAAGTLTGLLSRSLPQRAAIRNLFRRLKLTIATIFLIALGLGITAGFVITLISILDSSSALFRRNKWDIVADFREPQSNEKSIALCEKAGLTDHEPFVKGYASLSVGKRTIDYQLIGMPADSKLSSPHLTEGTGFSGNDADEIIFNPSFSDFPPPSIGDTVVITSRGQQYRLTVVGLFTSLSTGQAYVPVETARRIMGIKGDSGFMARLQDTNVTEAKGNLYGSPLVSRVTVNAELESAINDQLKKATDMIVLAVFIGAFVALAIVINTMSMNILERESEFATLMSLGYGRMPLARMVLTEICVMGISALVLSVPIAFGIAHYMNAELSKIWFHIDTYVKLKDLALSLLVPFLLLPVAALPALHHVFRIDVALVVRKRSIE